MSVDAGPDGRADVLISAKRFIAISTAFLKSRLARKALPLTGE
jgi:hypothetical protein